MKRTHTRPTLALIASGLLALTLGACGSRVLLTPTHALASREAFRLQTANPEAGTRPQKIVELDSQDAETIAKNYRSGMASEGSSGAKGNILMLSPPGAGAATNYMPAPSVPH